MKLNKYTWNNGTKSSPIVLTNDQIKKLIAIGQRKDIESKISGYVTTASRKMQKFLKYALESQFKDLNIICDEELTDIFNISIDAVTIEEGTSKFISIDTDSGISHRFLKWKYDFSNFVINGDISEQNIKNRIRVKNGYLVVDDPKENASWSVQLTLTAYPSYYSEEEFNNIPTSSKPKVVLNIVAKRIEDISISTTTNVYINSKVKVSVSPIPADATKLKGATYTYSTNTPDILDINISTQGSTIFTKKEGTANLIVTLHACNNTVTKSNSITFTVYGLRPVVFIIDQRYILGLNDPDGMVSENYALNPDGSLTMISINGAAGNPNNNTLTWLRQNTHAYVSRYSRLGIRLKQLSDSSRKTFVDGSSAASYISNENGEYDVFLKFGSDIYYKTEPWIPNGQSKPDPDYVAVTIATKLPANEEASKWCKWSQYKLVGVYEACQIKNKLYSLSGKRPVNKISQVQSINGARARGVNFKICDYDMTKLFAFLFYGYYSSLGSQQICGYGTDNHVYENNYTTYYPKITGSTDELGMTDTNLTTGTGAKNPSVEQTKAGIGPDIKTVNFWGLESCWGDISEWIYDLRTMKTSRRKGQTLAIPELYVTDYFDEHNGNIVVTKPTGIDVIYDSKSKFLEDYPNESSIFVAVLDSNGNIIRIIDTNKSSTASGFIEKMLFGAHADIIFKTLGGNARDNTGFTDTCDLNGDKGTVAIRSFVSDITRGGVGFLNLDDSAADYNDLIGARLIYDGDETTVHVIDPTEEL